MKLVPAPQLIKIIIQREIRGFFVGKIKNQRLSKRSLISFNKSFGAGHHGPWIALPLIQKEYRHGMWWRSTIVNLKYGDVQRRPHQGWPRPSSVKVFNPGFISLDAAKGIEK